MDRRNSGAIGAAALAIGMVIVTDAWVPFLIVLAVLLVLRLGWVVLTMTHED